MTIERRAYYTADIKAANDGTFEAVLSAPTLDRDGEVIDSLAFAPLPAKITIDIDHDMSVRSVVGSGEPYYDGDLLKIRGRFASTQLAQEVRTLVKEGHVDRMSVTFRGAQREIDENDGLPHVRKGELLNAAYVVIPSNREAAVLAAKATGLLTATEAREMAGLSPAGADTLKLTGIDALAADVARLSGEIDELKVTVAELVTKSFPEAPEAAPEPPAAEPAADERAAARQALAAKARAALARP